MYEKTVEYQHPPRGHPDRVLRIVRHPRAKDGVGLRFWPGGREEEIIRLRGGDRDGELFGTAGYSCVADNA